MKSKRERRYRKETEGEMKGKRQSERIKYTEGKERTRDSKED
jgi:hypothetical protein